MNYPMKEIHSMGGTFYREMTPEEYESELNFYRAKINDYLSSTARRVHEYGLYLLRWFSEESCDGYTNYTTRYRLHRLPQTANGFMFE